MLDGVWRAAALLVLGAVLAGCASEDVALKRTVQPIVPASIEGLPSAFAVGDDVVLAGQPTPALLSDLKFLGFGSVINLRPDNEMSFPEDLLVRGTTLKYVSIPVKPAGPGNAEIKAFLDEVRGAMKRKERVLVHCSTANRAAALWAIYEITDLQVKTEDAVARARQAAKLSPEMVGAIGQYARAIGVY